MPYAKIIYVFGFLSICQSASVASLPAVLPEHQFDWSTSFARVPVSPERQFGQFHQSASFARAPVLPECQLPFCQWKLKEFAAFLSNHIIY
jgi:hypothetical protein